MEANISTRAVLTFESDLAGNTVRINVPRAKSDLTEAQARSGMAAIVAANAVMTANGRPTAPKSASIVSTERTRLI